MKLYHGAPRKARSKIQRDGLLRFTWFTTSIRDALEFAALKEEARDIWEIRIDRDVLQRVAWLLGGKRGLWYKFYKKPPKAKLVKSVGKKRWRH